MAALLCLTGALLSRILMPDNYLIQLFWRHTKAFPRQLRGIISSACPGDSSSFPMWSEHYIFPTGNYGLRLMIINTESHPSYSTLKYKPAYSKLEIEDNRITSSAKKHTCR